MSHINVLKLKIFSSHRDLVKITTNFLTFAFNYHIQDERYGGAKMNLRYESQMTYNLIQLAIQ